MKFVIFAFISAGALFADQITMKNGDRFTGAIQKSDGKTITIKSDYAGVINLPVDAVVAIKSDKALNVVLKEGKTIVGSVESEKGRMEVASKESKQEVPVTDVTALRDADEQKAFERLAHPGWTDLWAGAFNLGLAGTAGNSRTLTFTTLLNAARATKTDKTSIYFAAVKASATVNGVSSETAQAIRGGLAYNHNVSARIFLTGFNDWEYDRFQDLDLRLVVGGGAGYSVIKSDRTRLDVLAGVDYSHSSYGSDTTVSSFANSTVNSAEGFYGNDFSYKLSKATSLVQSFRMFNDFSNSSNFRVNFDAGAATQLKKWLNWNVTLSDRYLNDPVPGRKRNDFLYSTGVGITFAR